jgi:hypothetical protein
MRFSFQSPLVFINPTVSDLSQQIVEVGGAIDEQASSSSQSDLNIQMSEAM